MTAQRVKHFLPWGSGLSYVREDLLYDNQVPPQNPHVIGAFLTARAALQRAGHWPPTPEDEAAGMRFIATPSGVEAVRE